MALTLRPSGLSHDPDAHDWSIHEDGDEIGRLYEDPTAMRPEIAWFWSSQSWGLRDTNVRTDGRAATLEQAKADFPDALGSVQGEPEDRLNKSPRGWEAACS
jgi:hypothetical protein